MAKINVSAFTDKGVLGQKVKKEIRNYEVEQLNSLLTDTEYQSAEKAGTFVKSYFDSNGMQFYAVLQFKTTSLHPDEAAKSKTKSTTSEDLEITIE